MERTLFDPSRRVRDGGGLLGVVIDPELRLFRLDDPVDLVHRRLRLPGIEVEARYAPVNEVALEMGDVAAQDHGT